MITNEQKINMWVMAAADSIDQLRSCDVWRVLESADRGELLDETISFIETNRPDLRPNIESYKKEQK